MVKENRHKLSSFALVGALAAVLAPPPAQAAGDALKARAILTEHCIACHEAPGFPVELRQPAVNALSFPQIANNPETYTRAHLERFLRQPHYPMRGFTLSPSDIANILAYIDSLRAGH